MTAQNANEAFALIESSPPDAVITDIRMPGMDGLQLFQRIQELHPNLPIVIMSAFGTIEVAVEALKLGAFDYLSKPFTDARIKQLLDSISAFLNPVSPDTKLSLEKLIVGQCPAMAQLRSHIQRASCTDSTVFILGEEGTGKALVARVIHQWSGRREHPYMFLSSAMEYRPTKSSRRSSAETSVRPAAVLKASPVSWNRPERERFT